MNDWCHTNNILQVHCWGCLVVQVMFHALMTSLMTSQDHKVGQILKLIYLRQYFSYIVDQKLKMSEMFMAILLVYSTSDITSGKKVCRELKMAAIFLILQCQTQLQFDLRYEEIVPKKYFHDDDVIDDVTGWPQSFSLYSCLGEIGSGSKLKGNVSSINSNIIIVFLGYTCRKTISMNNTFRDCKSKVNITGLLGDLGINKQHCKLSQMQLFLRLWRHR